MSRMLLALPLFLIACNTTDPESWTQKTFTRADCKDLHVQWKPDHTPTQWQAYAVSQNEKTPVDIAYKGEFDIGCGNFSDSGSFEIYYR